MNICFDPVLMTAGILFGFVSFYGSNIVPATDFVFEQTSPFFK